MTEKELLELLKTYPENLQKVRNHFASYRRKRQTKVLIARILRFCACIAGLLIIFMLLERTPLQSEVFRYLGSGIGYFLLIYWAILALRSFTMPPSDIELGVEIEQATGKFRSALSSSAEFTFPDGQENTTAVSEALKKLTVSKTATELSEEDKRLALKSFSRKQAFMAFLVTGCILMFWYSAAPSEVSRGTRRLLNPFSDLMPYSSLEIVLMPGDRVIAKGEDLQISAIPNQPIDRDPVLEIFDSGEKEGTVTEMYPEDPLTRTKFLYNLTSLQESMEYRVSHNKYTTERFSITVVPRPEIKNLSLVFNYPSYISSMTTRVEAASGDCTVLKGTKVKFEGEASQTLKNAQIRIDERTLDCDIESGHFSATAEIASDTKFSALIENEHGLKNENPVNYRILSVEDASPTVVILKPAADIPFPKSKRLDIKVVARDDFGVASVILYYSVGTRRSFSPLNMKADFTPVRDFEIEYPWLLDTLAIAPGTRVSYYIHAEDAKTPDANMATTPVYIIDMPSMYDVYRGSDDMHQNISERLNDILEEQKVRREALTKAYEQIKHEGKLDYETEKQLESAIDQSKDKEKEAREILDKFDQMHEQYKDNPFSSPEALERMQKLEELLNEVLDDETRRLREELMKSLEDMKIDPSEIEKFEQAFKMDEYLKNLDRSIELLTQLREVQRLNSLGNALEDLKNRQELLASQTEMLEQKQENSELTNEEKSQLDDMIRQQEKIKQELEELKKEAEELAKLEPKAGETENPLLEDVKNIRDQMQNEDFRKMSDEIKEGLERENLKEARARQQEMLKFLDSLAQKGQKICQTCSGGQTQLDLSRFIREAISVSRDQERLYKQIEPFPDQFMRGQKPEIEGIIEECSILQVIVKQRGQKLQESIDSFIRTSFAIDPSILDPVDSTQGIFASIVKNLEDRALGEARGEQREIIRCFNILAMELMKKQDEGASSSSMSPMNALQQFKELTKRQLSLYQETMKRQMSSQNRDAMEQMRQMAMRQRMIRESLERLLREGREQMRTLGRLDDLLQEMQDIETEILDPNKQKQVAERQKAVYDRMLKAMKSIKNRDEESEERKAEAPREIITQDSADPLPELGSDSRDLSKDFLGEIREDYPPEFKALLQDYYKSLSLYGESN